MIRLIAALLLIPAPALADPPKVISGPITAKVVSVYDGDTFRFDAYPFPRQTIHVSVRLRGVDTPEIRGKCDAEKAKAILARDFVREEIGDVIRLRNIQDGKYAGRVIADATKDGFSLADILIAAVMRGPMTAGRVRGGATASSPSTAVTPSA